MVETPINLQNWLQQFQQQQDVESIRPKQTLETFSIVYPELPPTSNHIYFQGTRLTKEAKAYGEKFSAFIRSRLSEIVQIDPNAVYYVELYFFFEVINATWNNPKIPPSKRAEKRYKKVDLDNRIKLLVDCVRDAIGVDDSQIFAFTQEKHHDPVNPRVEILIRRVSPALFGIEELPTDT